MFEMIIHSTFGLSIKKHKIMKTIYQVILLMFLITSCSAQLKTDIDQMTPTLWEEDIEYVEKKIQKEFASFDQSIKETFSQNANSLKKELSSLNNQQVAIKMGQLLASLKDGHTELSILQRTANMDRLPLLLYYFEDGLYIVASHDAYKDLIGKKVVQIGTMPVSESVERLKEVMTYDNEYEILHAGPSFLMLPDVLKYLGAVESTSEVPLIVMDDTEVNSTKNIIPVNVETYNNGTWQSYFGMNDIATMLYKKHLDKNYWYEYLEDKKTMYFYLGRVNNQKGQTSLKKVISQLFDAIDKVQAEKLVIDVRKNSGGNYNKSRPLIDAIKDRPSLNKLGKIFVVNGRTTFSAAMVATIFLKTETNAIVVGEPSRGHPNKCDNNEYMSLPNSGLNIEYTTKVKEHWSELGDANHVPVDVIIPPTFAAYKMGEDAVLNYIVKQ